MPRFLRVSLLSAAILAAAAGSANAAGNLTFNGLVTGSCALTLGSAGGLGVSTDGLKLSSTEAGGFAANALLLTTSGTYQVQVDPISALAAAPSGGGADSVDVAYAATGVTSIVARAAGTPLNLNVGLTNVKVDVTAQKATVFPAGLYRADVTVRCVSQ